MAADNYNYLIRSRRALKVKLFSLLYLFINFVEIAGNYQIENASVGLQCGSLLLSIHKTLSSNPLLIATLRADRQVHYQDRKTAML